MRTFLDCMRWVEEEHCFPEDPRHFHGRRFAELARLSDLWSGMPPLVVVTGSCGKASTSRFLGFMLRAAGKTVGLGTKPPLQESAYGNLERYQRLDAGDHWIEPELFAKIARDLPDLARQVPPELGPLAPYDMRLWILLRAFQHWKVDIGIVEANIGLRQDPAGAIPNAALTIITPVATDHAPILPAPPEWAHLGAAAGPLWHKMSAVPSSKVVVGRQSHIEPGPLDDLLNRPGPRLGRDFTLSQVRSGLWGGSGVWQSGRRELNLRLSCLGEFQVENAAVAAAAFFELGEGDESAVLAGAKACQIPGRLEVLGREPLQLLAAVGSLSKVQGILESLETLFESDGEGVVVVLSMLDRLTQIPEVVRYIARHPRLRALVVTQCDYPDESRDVPAAELATLALEARPELQVFTESRFDEAIARGRAVAGERLLLLLGNGLAASVSTPAGLPKT